MKLFAFLVGLFSLAYCLIGSFWGLIAVCLGAFMVKESVQPSPENPDEALDAEATKSAAADRTRW